MMPQIATANRLTDGEVVFLGVHGWVERIERASVARSDGETKALEALARQSEAVNEVVSAYLLDIREEARGPWPVHFREQLRARGPSVRLDLGKQAIPLEPRG
jgi:sulfite reductase (NADPH) hemoprotein beta-component